MCALEPVINPLTVSISFQTLSSLSLFLPLISVSNQLTHKAGPGEHANKCSTVIHSVLHRNSEICDFFPKLLSVKCLRGSFPRNRCWYSHFLFLGKLWPVEQVVTLLWVSVCQQSLSLFPHWAGQTSLRCRLNTTHKSGHLFLSYRQMYQCHDLTPIKVTPPTNSPMSEIQQFVTGLAHIQHFPFAICVNICHVHFFLLRYFIYISNILAILSIIPSKTNSFICRSGVWCITCSILICLYLAGQFWGWLWPGGGGLLRRAACFPVGRRSPAGATELCSEPSTCSPHPG